MAVLVTLLLWIGRLAAAVVSLVIVGLATYLTVVQPWHLGWGATDAERGQTLPGDEIVPDPDYCCTRAITIGARAERVWPWLVQIGQDRAGFYSYDWLERLMGLEIENVDRIVAEWQSLAVGDRVGLGPGVTMGVAALEPGRWLVYDMGQWHPASWAFVLDPIDGDRSRLTVRMRGVGKALYYSPFDPGHFIMERKMMLRIKELAEGTSGSGGTWHGNEVLWFTFLLAAAPGLLLLAVSRRWPWALPVAAIATAGWVLLLFPGHPSALWGGLLVGALVAAHLWAWRAPGAAAAGGAQAA